MSVETEGKCLVARTVLSRWLRFHGSLKSESLSLEQIFSVFCGRKVNLRPKQTRRPGFSSLRGVLGHRTSGVKTEKVPGKPGWPPAVHQPPGFLGLPFLPVSVPLEAGVFKNGS